MNNSISIVEVGNKSHSRVTYQTLELKDILGVSSVAKKNRKAGSKIPSPPAEGLINILENDFPRILKTA
jgi:hypothetical protein